ncbi:Protein of unknown function DUF4246 [Penicillium sp. IBT 18751x]|nr:Protein of unknown function DUF4246 [Penicillium sp. IBT 18751x]
MSKHHSNEEGLLKFSKNTDPRLTLPGFGRPLDYAPQEQNIYGVKSRSMFPSALDDRDIAYGYTELPVLTLREIEMLKIMEDITDIPQWWKKIHEPGTSAQWKKLAMNSGTDISKNMANWIVEELKYKAMIYELSNAVTLYNGDITKSDTNVPDDILRELRRTSKILEYEEDELHFYHPGSMSKQRDLLPMALYPLIYGKSHILTDRVIRLDEALRYAGQGEVIPVPKESGVTREDLAWRVAARADIKVKPYSRLFQILPSDWEIGDDGLWHIATYINNLHPVKCKDTYKVIEDAFNRLVPQFNMSMTPLRDMLHSRARIEYHKAEYCHVSQEVADTEPKIQLTEAQSEFDERDEKWRMEKCIAVQPDAGEFIPWAVPQCLMTKLPEDLPSAVRIERPVNLSKDYKERGLQVITRLIGVDLTPEDPIYQTDWHVEAFVHFDVDNIKDASMEFRNIIDTGALEEVEHGPNDFVWLKQVFGLENGEPAIQQVGSIKCPVGRTVIFTSMVQHRYTGFELLDPTKPGHLRALVFYLVDPNIRIISTANIPPQRLDWTLDFKDDEGNLTAAMAKLALDHKNDRGNMPMSLNEAQEYRVEALEELIEFMRYQHVAFESNILML